MKISSVRTSPARRCRVAYRCTATSAARLPSYVMNASMGLENIYQSRLKSGYNPQQKHIRVKSVNKLAILGFVLDKPKFKGDHNVH